jgi:hypothetical protein
LNIIKKTALYFARKQYCKAAILEHADLSAIKEKPTPSMVIGLILIAVSYAIGLPAVVALGILAVWVKKPLVLIIGGPVIYTISTILFILGIKMAGKKYFRVFCRWMVRVVLEKILGEEVRVLAEPGVENKCG